MSGTWIKTPISPGDRFDRLIAIQPAPPEETGQRRFLFKCDCGNNLITRIWSVFHGATRSCGCLNRDIHAELSTKHGKSKTMAWRSWLAARARCYNPKNALYHNYGGRGIKMCERWRYDFMEFFKDMGERPHKHSLDRIDNNGDYEPGNCRWATSETQRRNTRRNVFVESDGEKLTLTDFAVKMGVKRESIRARMRRLGETPQQAAAHLQSYMANG